MTRVRVEDVPRSAAYLLASFPLGLLYFAFVTLGVTLGVALLVLVVGVVVLAGVAAVGRRVASADAAVAARLFGFDAPSLGRPRASDGLLDAAVAELTHPSGYRAVAYLLARFAVGVAGFALVVGWLATAGALLAAPLYYDEPGATVGVTGVYEVHTLAGALAFAGFGVVVAVLGGAVVGAAGRSAARMTSYVLSFPPRGD